MYEIDVKKNDLQMYENVANILKFIKSTSLCYIQTDSDPHKTLIKFSFIFSCLKDSVYPIVKIIS